MTIAVDLGRKATKQNNNKFLVKKYIFTVFAYELSRVWEHSGSVVECLT